MLEQENYSVKIDIPILLQLARVAALEAGQAIMDVYESEDFGVEKKADASPLTRADKAAHQIIENHLQDTGIPILCEEGELPKYNDRKHWEWFWLVDPLDGTKEFIKRNGEFTVNIALVHHQHPVAGVVYAPALETLYYGSKQTGAFKEQDEVVTQLKALPERPTFQDLLTQPEIILLASRSHLNQETAEFIQQFSNAKIQNIGSSLKFMLIAENKADLNPRFGPTMEWDTAASHAILSTLNRGVYHFDLKTELIYNKPSLYNPSFLAY